MKLKLLEILIRYWYLGEAVAPASGVVRRAGEAEAPGDTDTVLEILILEILIRYLGEAVAPD